MRYTLAVLVLALNGCTLLSGFDQYTYEDDSAYVDSDSGLSEDSALPDVVADAAEPLDDAGTDASYDDAALGDAGTDASADASSDAGSPIPAAYAKQCQPCRQNADCDSNSICTSNNGLLGTCRVLCVFTEGCAVAGLACQTSSSSKPYQCNPNGAAHDNCSEWLLLWN